MKRLSLISLLLALVCLPLPAQQMSVEAFVRLKGCQVEKDKTVALLDLVTDQKGFTILCNGNNPVEVEEQDSLLRLKLPHKTTRLSIQHPSFGQLAWSAPETLRKNRHYRALLYAIDPTQELKATRQWVVFRLSPEDALVQIDSVSKPVRSSVMEYYLPVGDHTYKVEAPFYQSEEGTFTLTDSVRQEISVSLQPFYSFISVKMPWRGGALYVDGAHIDWKDATSYRLSDGNHRVSLFWGGACYYDSLVYVGPAQKKLVEIRQQDFYPRGLTVEELKNNAKPVSSSADSTVLTPVKLSCKDPEAEILVDRECVGKGQWEGNLPLGFHLLGARKDGQEGAPTRLWCKDSFPQEITLMVPGSGAGLVNIRCNVKDARILLDGEDRGTAPQLLQLDASRTYELIVYKPGYKDRKTRIRPKGNAQVDVYMQLKKR